MASLFVRLFYNPTSLQSEIFYCSLYSINKISVMFKFGFMKNNYFIFFTVNISKTVFLISHGGFPASQICLLPTKSNLVWFQTLETSKRENLNLARFFNQIVIYITLTSGKMIRSSSSPHRGKNNKRKSHLDVKINLDTSSIYFVKIL